MRKIVAVLGVSAFLIASSPLVACDMGKDHEAKGSMEKQSYSKTERAEKGSKWSRKAAKKDQASKTDKAKAKL